MSGAGRKSSERERSGERTFQKTLERERSVHDVERGAGPGGGGAGAGWKTSRAGLTNVGPCSEKCVGPPSPYTVESRIESKMVHPFNMDKRPTTVLFNDNVCQLKIKDRKIQAVL